MDAPYYLPLSVASAEAFFEHRKPFEEPIEAAAMFSALTCLQKPMSHVVLDRLVRDAFPEFRKDPEGGSIHLMRIKDEMGIQDVNRLVDALFDVGIILVKLERIKNREWLAPDGGYSKDFQSRCLNPLDDYDIVFYGHGDYGSDGDDLGDEFIESTRHRSVRMNGTSDQSRVMRIVATMPDEHIAIDAYAGTGKTFW